MKKPSTAYISLALLAAAVIVWIAADPPEPPLGSSLGVSSGPASSGKYRRPGNYLETIMVKGTRRTFAIHIPPSYWPGTPTPLVINIHGRTATAFQQEDMTQMNVKADEKGFIAIHPQAVGNPPTWWGPIPNEIGQPDMDFFKELLAYVQREINIDPARIYATGISNGATMANRLGCDMSDTFSAIAPVSGGHVAFEQCQIDRPISVLVFHGRQDTIIPYEGDAYNPPVRDWVDAWVARNGCDRTPLISQPRPTITRESWDNCRGTAEVVLYSIEDAGHTWPGSQSGAHYGGYTLDINATDVIWDFFASHPGETNR